MPGRRAPGRQARAAGWTAAGLALIAFAASWYRHATFRSGTMDLAVFEQAIWKLAHLEPPEVTLIGWNAFADHLSPVLALFAALYRLAPTPLWLFAAQAVAFGAGYLALEPLFDAIGLPTPGKRALRVAYAVNPLLWNAVLFDFHPTTLAVPFLLAGLTAALTGNRRRLLLVSAVVVLLRDDLGLAVALMAAVGATAARNRGDWRFRVGLAAAGLAWVVLGGAVGSALGSDRHWTFHYGYLGSSPIDAALHPLSTAGQLIQGLWRGDNALLLLGLLLPLGFLPLLSAGRAALVLIMALPLLASAGPQFHSPQWHYGAPLFPFLLTAAAAGLARWRPPALDPGRLGLSVVSAALLGAYLFGPPATRALTRPTVPAAHARAALALVGADDTVAAGDEFGAQLAHRDDLLIYPYPFADPHPVFPLSRRATDQSPARVASVDTVIAWNPPAVRETSWYQAFLASPGMAGFRLEARYGDVMVWKRNPVASS